jgi:hypothetical protein
LRGDKGIFTHVSYRKDKRDCHPQKELVEILKSILMNSLKSSISDIPSFFINNFGYFRRNEIVRFSSFYQVQADFNPFKLASLLNVEKYSPNLFYQIDF